MEYLVIVMLTFMDGSVSKYNDGNWDVAASYAECQEKIGKATTEMQEAFKEHNPAPSTFIQACIQQKPKLPESNQ